MLWACLHFSDLPLHAVFDVDERRQRCALVDGPRRARVQRRGEQAHGRTDEQQRDPDGAGRKVAKTQQTGGGAKHSRTAEH